MAEKYLDKFEHFVIAYFPNDSSFASWNRVPAQVLPAGAGHLEQAADHVLLLLDHTTPRCFIFFFFKNTARPQGGGGGQSTRRALHSIHSFGAVTLWNGGLLVIVPKVPLLVAKGPVDKQRMRPRLGVRMLHMLAEENQQADCTLHLHHEQETGDHAWCSSPKTVPVGPKCSAFQNSTSCGLDYSLWLHAQLLMTPWPQSVLDIASTQTNALASGSPPQPPKN